MGRPWRRRCSLSAKYSSFAAFSFVRLRTPFLEKYARAWTSFSSLKLKVILDILFLEPTACRTKRAQHVEARNQERHSGYWDAPPSYFYRVSPTGGDLQALWLEGLRDRQRVHSLMPALAHLAVK